MIHDLYEYAKAHGLGLDNTKKQDVDFRLVLSTTGVRLEAHEGTINVPTEARSGDKPFPYRFFDNTEYVLGIPEESQPKLIARAKTRFPSFWKRVVELLTQAGDTQALTVVEAVLAHPEWLRNVKPTPPLKKGKSLKGWVALALDGEGFVLDREAVRRETLKAAQTALQPGPDHCVITGESCTAVRLHDKIDGVPGTGGGVPLVSFKAQTSAERGLDQGANWTASPKAMWGYTAALNEILKTKATVGDNTCIIAWGPPEASAITGVINLYATKETWPTLWGALDGLQASEAPLHLAGLKGSKGRIAVLFHETVRTGDVVKALIRFRDFFTGYLRGGKEPSITPATLGQSVSRKRDNSKEDRIPEMLRLSTVLSVLLDKSVPDAFVKTLLAELQPLDVIENTYKTQTITRWLDFIDPKHVSRRPTMSSTQEPVLTEYVRTAHDSEAYHLGTLVALLVSMKRYVHKGDFSNNIDASLYNRARNCPASFFDEGDRQFNVLLPKIRKYKVGNVFVEQWLEAKKRIQSSALCSNRGRLSLSQVGEFSQGRAHQMLFNEDFVRFSRAQSRRAQPEKEVEETKAAE